MKKNSLFFVFATLVAVVAMFVSCQKAEIVNDEDSLLLKKARLSAQQVTDAISWANGTNGTICAGTEFDICISFPQAYTGNGGAKATNGQVQLLVLGDDPTTVAVETEYWIQITHQNSHTGFCFNYTFNVAGTYSLRYKASNAQWSNATVVVVNCGCEESFSYATTDNKTVVFTYVSAVALENASVKFICPHITGWSSSATLVPNNVTNPTNLTWTGDIEACIPISWTITFIPDCEQNKGNKEGTTSFTNVWTEFEVNDVKKKNATTPNIVHNCQ